MKELLSDEEHARQQRQGYIEGAKVAAPQVYSLNMMVAAQAVWILMLMVSGSELNFDGVAIDAKGMISYTWKEANKDTDDCLTCGQNGVVFRGDEVDLLCKERSEPVLIPQLVHPGIKPKADPVTEILRDQLADNTKKIEDETLREMPIPSMLQLIIGEYSRNPFCPWS